MLGGKDDPWWHLWEMNIDGTGLKQLTFGPYHDVNPIYLPDSRIMFSSTRIGMRDEYHGFPCTGLTVCNSDGTKNITLYGPERRDFWHQVTRKSKVNGWSESPPRHRPLRPTQPQPFDDGRIVCATQGGLTLIGPGKSRETTIGHDKKMAVTCPYPLGDGKILCSASIKQFEIDGKVYTATSDEYMEHKGTFHLSKAINADLGLYILDAGTGELELLVSCGRSI